MWMCLKSYGCHCPGHLPLLHLAWSVFFFLSPSTCPPSRFYLWLCIFLSHITELFLGRKAQKILSGENNKIDQHPFTWVMSRVVSLHVYLISPSSVTEFSRSLFEDLSGEDFFFFKNRNFLLVSSDLKFQTIYAIDSSSLSRLAGDFPRVGIQSSILGI